MSEVAATACPHHAATTEAEASSPLFVAPDPRVRGAVWSGLARGAAGLSDLLNARVWHWSARGRQLNVVRAVAHRVGSRAAGIDPRLPRDYAGVIGALGKGGATHQLDCFARFERMTRTGRAEAAAARARGEEVDPYTPDGDTWTYTIPNRALPEFSGPHAVDTGFEAPDGSLQAVYVVRGAAALRAILGKDETFDRGALPYHFLQQTLGTPKITPDADRKAAGLFAGQLHHNATWKEDRRIGTRMFGPKRLNQLIPGMCSALDAICADVDATIAREPDGVFDAGVLMSRIAYRMVVNASFGNMELEGYQQLGAALTEPVRRMLAFVNDQVMGKPVDAEAFSADVGEAKEIIFKIAELVRAGDAAGRIPEDLRGEGVIRLILEDADADRLFALLLPVLFGGHETTGHTMAWALYELGRNPELRASIVAEIDRWHADHDGRPVTPRDYAERPLTQALLYEIGRRHAAVIAVPRTSTRAGELPPDPETGIGACAFPKDTFFMCSILGPHLDGRSWPDPMRFDIDRWLCDVPEGASVVEQGTAVMRTMRRAEASFRYFPFGAGPAKCLGQSFNMLEFFLVLDHLLHRYAFELVDPEREVRDSDDALSGPEQGELAVRIRARA